MLWMDPDMICRLASAFSTFRNDPPCETWWVISLWLSCLESDKQPTRLLVWSTAYIAAAKLWQESETNSLHIQVTFEPQKTAATREPHFSTNMSYSSGSARICCSKAMQQISLDCCSEVRAGAGWGRGSPHAKEQYFRACVRPLI